MQPEVTDEAACCPYCGFPEAEPEQDGDVLLWVCPDCEGAFGHRRIGQDGPVCAAGLPVQVPEERPAVFLGATIPVRRPE